MSNPPTICGSFTFRDLRLPEKSGLIPTRVSWLMSSGKEMVQTARVDPDEHWKVSKPVEE